MGQQVIKYKGLYSVYSTVVEDLLLVGGTRKEVIDYYIEAAMETEKKRITRELDKIDAGMNPYTQFKLSKEEFLKLLERGK